MNNRRYFLYCASANVADARALLTSRSLQYDEYDAIQDGVKELAFTATDNQFEAIKSEIFNSRVKVEARDGKLNITGSIGSVSADFTDTYIKVGSTDGTGTNSKFLKTASDGTITMPTVEHKVVSRTAGHSQTSVGVASTSVLAANANRKAALFVNASDETIYLGIGTPAVLGQGIQINSNGGNFLMNTLEDTLDIREVFAISTSGSKAINVTEWV